MAKTKRKHRSQLSAEGKKFLQLIKDKAEKQGIKFIPRVNPNRTHVMLVIRDEVTRTARPKRGEGPRTIPVIETHAPLSLYNSPRGRAQIWKQLSREMTISMYEDEL